MLYCDFLYLSVEVVSLRNWILESLACFALFFNTLSQDCFLRPMSFMGPRLCEMPRSPSY